MLEYCVGRKDTSFVVPDGVEVIGNESFWAAHLHTITLPESIINIESYAFEYSSLTNLILLAKTPPVLNDTSAFARIGGDLNVYCYSDSVERYKSATNWNALLEYDSELPTTYFTGDDTYMFFAAKTAAQKQCFVSKSDLDIKSHIVKGEVRADCKEYTDKKFNGANKAVSFYDYQEMISSLREEADSISSTYPEASYEELTKLTKYKVGQNIYIQLLNVPDLWVSDIIDSPLYPEDTSDENIINALSNDGMVYLGYYGISALETQKVDLTEYAEKKYVDDIAATKVKQLEFTSGSFLYSHESGVDKYRYMISQINDASGVKYLGGVPIYQNIGNIGTCQLTTGAPGGDFSCTNKKYVDDLVASIETSVNIVRLL